MIRNTKFFRFFRKKISHLPQNKKEKEIDIFCYFWCPYYSQMHFGLQTHCPPFPTIQDPVAQYCLCKSPSLMSKKQYKILCRKNKKRKD